MMNFNLNSKSVVEVADAVVEVTPKFGFSDNSTDNLELTVQLAHIVVTKGNNEFFNCYLKKGQSETFRMSWNNNDWRGDFKVSFVDDTVILECIKKIDNRGCVLW